MKLFLIVLTFIIISNVNHASNCHRVPRDGTASQEEATTTDVSTTFSFDSEELKDILKSKDAASIAVLISKVSKHASQQGKSRNVEESSKIGLTKAYACSKLLCTEADTMGPVCACNFNTGNVASFKNKCDSQKHNCRFDTNFKVILDGICPWEFAFRLRNKEFEFDYGDPKYYN